MDINVREYFKDDIAQMVGIWNEVVKAGNAFPQIEQLSIESGQTFFAKQSYCGVAEDRDSGAILGLYILHPNNVGRCGHICNTSYAVVSGARGLHIGEKLVNHSIRQGREFGFLILQFNAVVKSNASALHLYKRLGFTQMGTIPKGFLMPDGTYEDIIPHYRML